MTRALLAILLIGFAASLAGAGCRKRSVTSADDDIADPPTLPRLFAENISEIAIDDGFQKVILRRADGAWNIVAPLSEPAAPDAIGAILGELSRLEWGPEPVAIGRSEWDQFDLSDDQALELSIVSEGERLPALYLGNRGHARVGRNSVVHEIYQLNRYTFERELRLWRDLRIAVIDPDAITALSVRDDAGRTASARRDEGTWTLTSSPPPDATFDPAVPAELVHRLATVRAHDIADGVDRSQVGLDTPRLTITARAGDAATAIEVGNTRGELTYVGVAGDARVWTVKIGGPATIDHGPEDWFEPGGAPTRK